MDDRIPPPRPKADPPPPPTLDAALSHLVYLDAVNVATFKEWSSLNPGGVCVLIRALFERLPISETRPALLALLAARPAPDRAPREGGEALTPAMLADALGCFWNASIDAAHRAGDSTAFAMISGVAEGFGAVVARLNELAEHRPQPAGDPLVAEAGRRYAALGSRPVVDEAMVGKPQVSTTYGMRGGKTIPQVLVIYEFPPEDWKARDAFAAALRAPEQPS